MTNEIPFICKCTLPVETKYRKLVAYLEELPPVKSHDFVNTWICKVTWQVKIVKSSLSQYLESLKNVAGCDITLEGPTQKVTCLITWSCEVLSHTKYVTSALAEDL